MEDKKYDDQFLIPIETLKKRMGTSGPDKLYWKLLEFRYGIQPATEVEWHKRIDRLKSE